MSKCTVCGIRGIGSGKGRTFNDREDAMAHQMCLPDLELAYWENAHSDYGHESLVDGDSTEGIKDDMGYALDDCWVCHPENATFRNVTDRSGTSRQGMKMVVPLRASAEEKSTIVRNALPKGFRVSKSNPRGGMDVTLTGSSGKGDAKLTFTAEWDHAGRWITGTFNGRKVRNAKELLRVVGA